MRLWISTTLACLGALGFLTGDVGRAKAGPLIFAPFRSISPVADGVIGAGEYGSGFFVSFQSDTNPGRVFQGVNIPTSDADLSYEIFTSHSATSLFLAFRVLDEFIDAQPGDAALPFLNDGAEFVIDGDRVSNDFIPSDRSGNKEGFQILADTLGNQLTKADDGPSDPNSFTNADWSVGASLFSGGYIIEFDIPLALIDTQDGPGMTSATTGSILRFNAAVTDNDRLVSAQDTFGILWASDRNSSPFIAGEPLWEVDLKLAPAVPVIPEPSTLALFSIGTFGLLSYGWRRKRKQAA